MINFLLTTPITEDCPLGIIDDVSGISDCSGEMSGCALRKTSLFEATPERSHANRCSFYGLG
jgi:hypothetical protein